MKPTSIIFLIFSVILLLAGSGLRKLAVDKADEEDFPLFLQEMNEDGDLITTLDIDSEQVTKLVLNMSNAEINVLTGDYEPRIELVNYQINTFTNLLANGVLSIDDHVDLLTLFNLTGKGTQFHGLRHYLHADNFNVGERSVNVYLSNDMTLEELEINATKCDVSLSDIHNCLSYKVTADCGDISLLNVSEANAASLAVTEEGNVAVQLSEIADITADVAIGNCSFVAKQANIQSYNALTQDGSVYLDGNNVGPSYTASSAVSLVTCHFAVNQGDIIISELS